MITKRLFKRERMSKILEIINERGFVSLKELQRILGVSEITVRRDVKELNERALARKVYGGIKKIDSDPPEARFAERRMHHANEKTLVAKRAVELVEDGDTIFIDASSTTFEFAKLCKEKRNNLHVVTNSLITALELIKNPTNAITIIGGMIRNDNMSVVGFTAEKMVQGLNVEKAFVSCRAFEPNEGTFETNPSESMIKREMIKNSNKTYLLVDYSKLFKRATFLTIPVKRINAVLTDDKGYELLKTLALNVRLVDGKTK